MAATYLLGSRHHWHCNGTQPGLQFLVDGGVAVLTCQENSPLQSARRVMVFALTARGFTVEIGSSLSSDREASSTRPIDVQYAGGRLPGDNSAARMLTADLAHNLSTVKHANRWRLMQLLSDAFQH